MLNLVVAEHLYRAFPEATEGDLSRLRARVVSSEPLAEVARGARRSGERCGWARES